MKARRLIALEQAIVSAAPAVDNSGFSAQTIDEPLRIFPSG